MRCSYMLPLGCAEIPSPTERDRGGCTVFRGSYDWSNIGRSRIGGSALFRIRQSWVTQTFPKELYAALAMIYQHPSII
jgi:hypothetical protein